MKNRGLIAIFKTGALAGALASTVARGEGSIYVTGGTVVPHQVEAVTNIPAPTADPTDYRGLFTQKTPELGLPLEAQAGRQVTRFFSVFGTTPSAIGRFKPLPEKFYPTAHQRDLELMVIREDALGAARTDGSELKSTFAGSARESLVLQVTSDLAIYQQLKGGVSFDLKLSKLFANSPVSQPRPLHYGLVLERIEPGHDGMLRASISADDWQGASQAKPVWKIGPVHEDASATPYQVSMAEKDGVSLYDNIGKPKPDFKLALVPSAVPGTNEGGTKVPGVKLALIQEQQYYQLEYHMDSKLKKRAVNHLYTVPAYHALKVQRAYDEKHVLQRTSLMNLLIEPNRPVVNLNYFEREDRYTGDYRLVALGREVTFTLDTPKGWDPTKNFGKQAAERYEIKLTQIF